MDPEETAATPAGAVATQIVAEETEGNVVLPLADDVLSHNLGIPVVVACNKVRRTRWVSYY